MQRAQVRSLVRELSSHMQKKKFLSLRGREFALSAWARSEEMWLQRAWPRLSLEGLGNFLVEAGWVPSLLGYRMDGDSVGEAHPHERWPDESQLTSTSDSSHLICPQPPRRNWGSPADNDELGPTALQSLFVTAEHLYHNKVWPLGKGWDLRAGRGYRPRKITILIVLEQRSENVFCTKPESKYFRFCGPSCPCHNYPTLTL